MLTEYHSLTDDEFKREAEFVMLNTPNVAYRLAQVARELLSRFEQRVNTLQDYASILDTTSEFDIDAGRLRELVESHPCSIEDMTEMLSMLAVNDINNPAELSTLLNEE